MIRLYNSVCFSATPSCAVLIISDEVDDEMIYKCMMELVFREPILRTEHVNFISNFPIAKLAPKKDLYGPTRGPAPLPFDMTLKRRRRR